MLFRSTSAANILYRRAKRAKAATGDDRYKSQSEIEDADHTMKDHLVVLGKAFTLTFSEPIVFFLDLYTALLYGVLFIWFESFPLVRDIQSLRLTNDRSKRAANAHRLDSTRYSVASTTSPAANKD